MTFLDLLIYSLACFRLSLMVSKESGPARIFRKLRNLPPPKSSAREGLHCQWCTAVWSAAIIVNCYWYHDRLWFIEPWFIWPLSISAAAICLNQTFTKGAL